MVMGSLVPSAALGCVCVLEGGRCQQWLNCQIQQKAHCKAGSRPGSCLGNQSINQSIHQQLLVNTLVESASLCATGQSLLKTQENKQRPKETSL